MIKKFSSPKMQNREFVFTPKIEYKLVAERGEANQNSLTFPFWCTARDFVRTIPDIVAHLRELYSQDFTGYLL